MTVKAIYLSVKKYYVQFFSAHLSLKQCVDNFSASGSDEDLSSDNSKCNVNDTSTTQYDFLMDFHKWQEIEPKIFYTHRNDSKKPNLVFQRRIKLPQDK